MPRRLVNDISGKTGPHPRGPAGCIISAPYQKPPVRPVRPVLAPGNPRRYWVCGWTGRRGFVDRSNRPAQTFLATCPPGNPYGISLCGLLDRSDRSDRWKNSKPKKRRTRSRGVVCVTSAKREKNEESGKWLARSGRPFSILLDGWPTPCPSCIPPEFPVKSGQVHRRTRCK